MSFILDAIKKSEDERKRSKQPDLHSLQDNAVRSQAKVTHQKGRFFLLLVALTILTLSAWWLWPQISGQLLVWLESAQSARVATSVSDSSNSSSTPTTNADINIAAEQSQLDRNLNVKAAGKNYSSDDEIPPRNEVKELWQLPADFQAEIPALDFSFHVYSREPDKRTIIINGRRVREGQMVASGLKLKLISESGVILHYRDRFFHVDVIEKW